MEVILLRASILSLLLAIPLFAEPGYDAWLRYAPLDETTARQYQTSLPAIVIANNSPIEQSARDELIRGIRGMLGRTLRIGTVDAQGFGDTSGSPAIILRKASQQSVGLLPSDFVSGRYSINTRPLGILIMGDDERGVLYGTFELLRKIALGQRIDNLADFHSPSAPTRWVNQWDNLDGTIERGYGGRSIFWDNMQARADLARVSDYGRLLASVGINGCSINNVNANPRLLSPEFFPQIARIADAFRPWGVRVAISVDFGSPQSVGKLDTYDPLDPKVIAWWKSTFDALYQAVPDLGGVVLKADSEGRVGPSTYNRTHADAANVVARALKPHGGIIFYRGFVYDHHMDWNDPKNDRARAAYDNFKPLDGQFDDNAVIQIKNGPIDFQVREPASPLFGGLEKTSEAIELQVTQEYMGQARHTVFLVPMWKEALDFDTHVFDARVAGAPAPVKALVKGFVGVTNVGLDDTWFGNHMSQANLYGFGRLAWNRDLTAKQITDEWTRLTFGNDPKVVDTVSQIQLTSWRTYENYTGPLGLQTLTDITGNHYGVNVEASERNGWGQWHRADERGVGMDRTIVTGTGYIGQYRPAIANMYESLDTVPDDLVLFLHHVPYTYQLHSGKTVIQSIYDSHYEGADAVEKYVRDWKSLKGRIDDRRYQEILAQLEYQAGQAEVWRDAVNGWFAKTSGIPDTASRANPYRMEAESMKLDGYTAKDVTPWEDASGGKSVECAAARCTANFEYHSVAQYSTIRVRYFDQNNGASHFRLWVGDQLVDEWTAADRVPSAKIDSTSSARRSISGIPLRPGDVIRIEGVPDGKEVAALDYVEVLPE